MRAVPHDIITEILSCMPRKPLTRFKCVSKPWLNLINNPDFIKHQHERLNEFLLFYVTNFHPKGLKSLVFNNNNVLDNEEHQLNILDKIFVVGSSNGFLCSGVSFRGASFEFVLYNPITRAKKEKFISQTNWALYSTAFGFGYDSMTDDYKVVLVSELPYAWDSDPNRGKTFYRVHVYSLKADLWFKSFQEYATSFTIIEYSGYRCPFRVRISNAFVNNVLHWPAISNMGNASEWLIACFRLSDQEFYEIPLPDLEKGTMSKYYKVELAVLGGLIHLLVENVDFWVMKEYGVKDSWTKLYNFFDMEGVVISRPIAFWKEGLEILFEKEVKGSRGSKVLFSLDLKNQIVKDLGICLDCDSVVYYEKWQGDTGH